MLHQSFYFEEIKTTVGYIFILESRKGISCVLPVEDSRVRNIKANLSPRRGLIYHKKIIKNLTNFLEGKERLSKFPIVFVSGTVFQISVWKKIQKIPYGSKSNYSKIAKEIKKPRAVRSVGTAVGKNPIMIYIPCHRVITKSGSIGGYAWGIPMKKRLLYVESMKKDG